MAHPKDIGDRSTLAIMLALREAGYSLFVPFGENTRADLIIDDGERLLRVQCKTGYRVGGAVKFRTCSSYAQYPTGRARSRDYLGQIDCFAVYWPEAGAVYLIPLEDAPLRWNALLRVDPARNHQRRRIRHAADYEVGTVRISAPPDAASGGATAGPGATSGAGGSSA